MVSLEKKLEQICDDKFFEPNWVLFLGFHQRKGLEIQKRAKMSEREQKEYRKYFCSF
jgi:hypothetical protein